MASYEFTVLTAVKFLLFTDNGAIQSYSFVSLCLDHVGVKYFFRHHSLYLTYSVIEKSSILPRECEWNQGLTVRRFIEQWRLVDFYSVTCKNLLRKRLCRELRDYPGEIPVLAKPQKMS